MLGVGLNTSQVTKTYTTFTGADLKAVFHNIVIAELVGVSYTVTREIAPIYTCGNPDPRSFSKGKRGIAGTMVFQKFDRQALRELMDASVYVAKNDDYQSIGWRPINEISGIANDERLGVRLATPIYVDQIPPFDVTITYSNEVGHLATEKLLGVQILNEGNGISVDDLTNETNCTFVCRHVTGLQPRPTISPATGDLERPNYNPWSDLGPSAFTTPSV